MVEHSAREVVEILKKHNFYEYSIRGDHHKFRNDKGWTTEVAYSNLKDRVSVGVYSEIKRAIKGQSKWQLMHKR